MDRSREPGVNRLQSQANDPVTAGETAGHIRLNIGCGTAPIAGFVNLDREPGGDLQVDVANGLPFADASVQTIFSEQFIEQLSQGDGVAFLRECRRVLVPNGVVRIATVDFDALMSKYASDWRDQPWLTERDYGFLANRCEMLNTAMRAAGHHWLYNEDELVRLAAEAGLAVGVRRAFGVSDATQLRGLERRVDSSLIVEFTKVEVRDTRDALVSIVIPACHPEYFRASLESALQQTYSNLEILIGDDCSTGAIQAIVAERAAADPRIRYIRNQPTLGASDNFRHLFDLAQGTYIKFLNDDDVLLPACVERLVRCLEENPAVTLVTSHRQPVDAAGAPLPDDPTTERPVTQDSRIDGVSLASVMLESGVNLVGEPTTVLFRKRDLANVQPHMLSFGNRPVDWNIDLAMWLTLLGRGDAIYLIDTLSLFRRHEDVEPSNAKWHDRAVAAWEQLRFDARRLGLWNPDQPRTLRATAIDAGPEWRDDVAACVLSAEACLDAGELDAAQAALEQAVTLCSNDPRLRVALGNVHLRRGDQEAAARELLAATTVDPYYAPAHADLAAVLLYADQPDLAESTAQRALVLDPHNLTAMQILGGAHRARGRYVEAIEAYAAILRVRPEDADTLVDVGNCCAESGHLQDAKSFYAQALRIAPEHPAGIANLQAVEAELAGRPMVDVSILIPLFNRLDLTRQCLESLWKNTPEGRYEIVIVDNASSDGTAEFLRPLQAAGRIRALINSENVGFAGASNQAAAAATGRHLLFLNNDTEVKPGWFEPLVRILDTDPSVAAVGSKLLFADGTLQHAGVVVINDRTNSRGLSPYHVYSREPADLPVANEARTYQVLTAACLLVRRAAFESVGGFDTGYWNGYEDVDLCFKLQERGWRLVYEPQSVIIHYESQSGPERFRRESANLDRLRATWAGKVAPDAILQSDGTCAPANSGRVREYQRLAAASTVVEPPAGKPVASVVIVTYNSARTIRECLESVLRHASVPVEVIVVDNASRDATPAVLAEYGSRIQTVLNTTNAGFSGGTNQGIRAATGEHLVLLNPDTVVTQGWLEGLIGQVTPGVGAVGPVSDYVAALQKYELYMPPGGPVAARTAECARTLRIANAGKGVETKLLIGFCMLVPRAVFDDVGLLDEELFLGNDDLDLSWRLRQRGYRLIVATDTFVHHEGQASFASEPKPATARLVQESTDALFRKLEAHYGTGNVPLPADLWDIDWFAPTGAVFRSRALKVRPGLTSIIVLAYNGLEHTQKCLESLAAHTREPHELILVDNGSTDGTVEYLRRYAKAHEQVRVVFNRTNRGFAAGNNQGLAVARGEFALLLNNDTVVTAGWLGRMLHVLRAEPRTGIVGPVSNYVSGPQLVQDAAYSGLDAMHAFAATWAAEHAGQTLAVNRVVGFCLLARRDVIEQIGGLDEQYGSGNFEDDDFCIRAALAGYGSRIAQDVFIHHTGSQTFKAAKIDYRQSLERNWALFKSKWGMAADAPIERGYRFPTRNEHGTGTYVRLPVLRNEHTSELDGRVWVERATAVATAVVDDGASQPAGAGSRLPVVVFGAIDRTEVTAQLELQAPGGLEVVVAPPMPEGTVAKMLNEKLAAAGDSPVLLLSDGVVLPPGVLKRLQAALARDAKQAVVGPVANRGQSAQKVKIDYTGTGKSMRQFAVRRGQRFAKQTTNTVQLDSFCLLFDRAAFRTIGSLQDDRPLEIALVDYFERAAAAGNSVTVALDAYVHTEPVAPGHLVLAAATHADAALEV